jgi:hypothetical protein
MKLVLSIKDYTSVLYTEQLPFYCVVCTLNTQYINAFDKASLLNGIFFYFPELNKHIKKLSDTKANVK